MIGHLQQGNENVYKAIFESSPEVIVLLAKNGDIIDINRRVFDWLGFEVGEIIGKNFNRLSFLSDDSKIKVGKNLQKRMNGVQVHAYNIEFLSKSNEKKIGKVTATTIKNKNGEIVQSLVIIADVTKQQQIESQLTHQKILSDKLFDASASGSILINDKRKIVKINDVALKLFGRERNEVIGKTCHKFICPECDGKCPVFDLNENIDKSERLIAHKDGREIPIIKTVAKIRDGNNTFLLESFIDISNRVETEKALRESEETYRQLTENIDEVFWVSNPNDINQITYISPAFEQIWGISVSELYNRPELWIDMVHPEDRDYFNLAVARFFSKKIRLNTKYRIIQKGGTERWVWNKGFVISGDSGETEVFAGIIQDITLQKYTEDALIENILKYKSLFEFVADPVLLVNPKTYTIIDANKAACEMYRYDYSELLGMEITDLTSEPLKPLNELKAKGKTSILVYHIRKNGGLFPVETSSNLVDIDGKTVLLFSVRDITERKQLERRILKAVINTEEKERKRIAENLHDELGPFLSAIMMYVQELSSENIKPKQKEYLLNYLNEMVDIAIDNTKTISHNLMPAILSDFGLVKAVEDFCKKIDKLNTINIVFGSNIDFKLEDETNEIIIYRIIIELINNTLKHANAKKIQIRLDKNNDNIGLEYIDDGIGFDLNKALLTNSGLGLNNIINRLDSINGTYLFDSEKNGGVCFRFYIDLCNKYNSDGEA
ncbi:MAG: hypothetical protein DRJ05_02165 [Bacteroidetes bacterium]|nr:MAG: hypothetical protein DRJ05_02165 [Bacteroidota bacterium]